MSKFLNDLTGKQLTDKVFELTEPLYYESDILKCVIKIPTGFQTDFSSVPRVPFIYEMYGNRAHHEGTLHDYLYRIDCCPTASYTESNSLFLEAMEARDKSLFVRYGMYIGVVIGGWLFYHKKKVFDKI